MRCKRVIAAASLALALVGSPYIVAVPGAIADTSPAGAGPVFSPGGPDADDYGGADGYPLGSQVTTGQQRYLVGAYSHFD